MKKALAKTQRRKIFHLKWTILYNVKLSASSQEEIFAKYLRKIYEVL